jgi:hypothetical protein
MDGTEDGYDLTIHGLLRKRDELLAQLDKLRDDIATVSNDLAAVDRVLKCLGFHPEIELLMKPRARVTLYVRNEMRKFLLDELRKAETPLSSRELAIILATAQGKDIEDKGLLTDMTARVSRSVSILLNRRVLKRHTDEAGRNTYELVR